jgi:hypothetical protein
VEEPENLGDFGRKKMGKDPMRTSMMRDGFEERDPQQRSKFRRWI